METQAARPILRALYRSGSHSSAQQQTRISTDITPAEASAAFQFFPEARRCSITVAWHIRNGDVQPYRVRPGVRFWSMYIMHPLTPRLRRTSRSIGNWRPRSQRLLQPPKSVHGMSSFPKSPSPLCVTCSLLAVEQTPRVYASVRGGTRVPVARRQLFRRRVGSSFWTSPGSRLKRRVSGGTTLLWKLTLLQWLQLMCWCTAGRHSRPSRRW